MWTTGKLWSTIDSIASYKKEAFTLDVKGAMSKYGDFEVVRTERRVPKKATDPNVDADGMREYSFLKCPHCKTEDIIIASLNLKIQKHATIREHVAVCPSYTGERPVKRCKEKKESTALVVRAPTASPESESTGISLEEKFRSLQKEMADLKQENADPADPATST